MPTNTVLIEELESSVKSEKSESPVVTHETDSETEKGSDTPTPAVSKSAEESAQKAAESDGTELGEETAQDDVTPVNTAEDQDKVTVNTDGIEYIDSEEPGSEEVKNQSCEAMEIDNEGVVEKSPESKETVEGFQIIDAPKVPEGIVKPSEDTEQTAATT